MIRECNALGEWYKPWTWGSSSESTPPGTTSDTVAKSQYDEPIGPVMPASAVSAKPVATPVRNVSLPSTFDNPMNLILAAGVIGMLGIGYSLVKKRG